MRAIRPFLDSAAGRFFLLLVVGSTLSALATFMTADAAQRQSFRRLSMDWMAQRIVDNLMLMDDYTPAQRENLLRTGLVGLWRAPAVDTAKVEFDDQFTKQVRQLAPTSDARMSRVLNPEACGPLPPPGRVAPPACWLVEVTLADGQRLRATHMLGGAPSLSARLWDPVYFLVLAFASALLALVAAYLSAQPLHRLAEAAKGLGENLERPPLRLEGPSEVRAAIGAFNAMQDRLRQILSQRARVLGAVAHDLQTPLTRMRLRVEKIEDPEMRTRLVHDLAAMQQLIKEGLELARSADTSEEWRIVDLRALLESLVEDAVDAGHKASLLGDCTMDIRARPEALRRCLQNLINNGVAYGERVEVSCEADHDGLSVRIRDYGAGVPDAELERIFEPFYRLENSRSRDTGGSGLGLTIARGLAAKNNASLSLHNCPAGGLEAELRFEKSSIVPMTRSGSAHATVE